MWFRALMVVTIYHVLIGVAVVSSVHWEETRSFRQKLELALMWPVVVSSTNYMQRRYVDLMDDIRATLAEINSGRWERKP